MFVQAYGKCVVETMLQASTLDFGSNTLPMEPTDDVKKGTI